MGPNGVGGPWWLVKVIFQALVLEGNCGIALKLGKFILILCAKRVN